MAERRIVSNGPDWGHFRPQSGKRGLRRHGPAAAAATKCQGGRPAARALILPPASRTACLGKPDSPSQGHGLAGALALRWCGAPVVVPRQVRAPSQDDVQAALSGSNHR
eukprot:scaffold8008_cov430-Prasinococcus_capsulatus_cf.AAC.2